MFDRTGTLTKGDPQVVHQEMKPTQMLSLAVGIVGSNEHRVSVAVAAAHLSTTTPAHTKLHLDSIISTPGVESKLLQGDHLDSR